jgi:hypothetical protein
MAAELYGVIEDSQHVERARLPGTLDEEVPCSSAPPRDMEGAQTRPDLVSSLAVGEVWTVSGPLVERFLDRPAPEPLSQAALEVVSSWPTSSQ